MALKIAALFLLILITFLPILSARFFLFCLRFRNWLLYKDHFSQATYRTREQRAQTIRKIMNTGWILTGILGLYLWGYCYLFGRTDWENVHVTFQSKNVPPAFDGYRIVQISDLHLATWTWDNLAIADLVAHVQKIHPDLILFTGDLVTNKANEAEKFVPELSKLHAPDGVYSIIGNHDNGPYFGISTMSEEIENGAQLAHYESEMGWNLLQNEHVFLTKTKANKIDSIALIGVSDMAKSSYIEQYAKLYAAMQGTAHYFSILMAHNPDQWRYEVVPKTDIPITLSGHTHAFQIKILGMSPAAFKFKFWEGTHYSNDSTQMLHVNIGVGQIAIPIRIGSARPEITILELKRKK